MTVLLLTDLTITIDTWAALLVVGGICFHAGVMWMQLRAIGTDLRELVVDHKDHERRLTALEKNDPPPASTRPAPRPAGRA